MGRGGDAALPSVRWSRRADLRSAIIWSRPSHAIPASTLGQSLPSAGQVVHRSVRAPSAALCDRADRGRPVAVSAPSDASVSHAALSPRHSGASVRLCCLPCSRRLQSCLLNRRGHPSPAQPSPDQLSPDQLSPAQPSPAQPSPAGISWGSHCRPCC